MSGSVRDFRGRMCYVAISGADEAVFAVKFAVMKELLDERQWRIYLGTEANALGCGGLAAVARASGASPATVTAGAAEAADPEALAVLEPGRSRRDGAGRPRADDVQPGLRQALDGLLEEGRRGDPVPEITWSVLSLRDIARQMALQGFPCGKDAISRLMHEDGWSLQGMSRVTEGKQHGDRDARFRHINARIAEYQAAGDPVVSIDGKKKEQLGPYHRPGRSWRPAGDPVKVRDRDFPGARLGKVTPYGIYGIAANTGFVSVGTSHDTAAFAVNALLLWWRAVARFPPGTSKWNKIGHRLSCHPDLEGAAPDDQGGRRGRHRRGDHLPGPEGHRRPRRRRLPRQGEDQRPADEVPRRARPGPRPVPRRVELRGPARCPARTRAGTGTRP
jgi:hypothetical protein